MQNPEVTRKANMSYLVPLVLNICLGSMPVGYVLAGNNVVGEIVAIQLEWGERSTFKNTTINGTAVFGMVVGALSAGLILPIGRRKTMYVMNLLIILGTCATLFPIYSLILVGKLVFGFGCGGTISACGTFLAETIPPEKSQIFGTSLNTGIITGLALALVPSLGLPAKDAPEALTTNYWRIINGTPILFSLVNTLLWYFKYPYDALLFTIKQKNDEDAKEMIKLVYRQDSTFEYTKIFEGLQKMVAD